MRVWLNVRPELYPASWAVPGVSWDEKWGDGRDPDVDVDGDLVELPDDLAERAVAAYRAFMAVSGELEARRGEAVPVPDPYDVREEG